MEHFDTIHDSPSQIYHSALPFCPVSSWLCEQYSAELSNDVKVVKGLPIEWGKCSRTVTLDCGPWCLSHWKNTAAVGLLSGDIIILNVITGSCVVVLSGHSDVVVAVSFSSDGALLVSGSVDETIKLWDIQTGGIVKTFSGHTDSIVCVSISADSALIASGSDDKTIRLWDIQKGVCQCVMKEQAQVQHVSLSPIEPYNLISLSKNKIREWDVYGNQVGEAFDGSQIAFSPDGTKFALYYKRLVTIQNTKTRAIMAEFHLVPADGPLRCCCFSPDSRLVAVATTKNINVWDITNLNPQLVETLPEDTSGTSPLAFSSPSTLISALFEKTVKFWQIHSSSADPTQTHMEPIKFSYHESDSLTLQAKHGIAMTANFDGSVRIWDISTGLCKETLKTPAEEFEHIAIRLVDDGLLIVWNTRNPNPDIHIWDAKGAKTTLSDTQFFQYRVSEDGSRLFYSLEGGFQVWSIQTGELVGEVKFDNNEVPLFDTVDGCRVWTTSQSLGFQGWEFSTPGSSPVQLSNMPPSKLHPCGTVLWDIKLFRVQDIVTGKVVFQFSRGFRKPLDVQWNKQYLVIFYRPADILILDFGHLIPNSESI